MQKYLCPLYVDVRLKSKRKIFINTWLGCTNRKQQIYSWKKKQPHNNTQFDNSQAGLPVNLESCVIRLQWESNDNNERSILQIS